MHAQLADLDFWCSKSIVRKRSHEMIQQHQFSRKLRAHYYVHNKMMATTYINCLTLGRSRKHKPCFVSFCVCMMYRTTNDINLCDFLGTSLATSLCLSKHKKQKRDLAFRFKTFVPNHSAPRNCCFEPAVSKRI